ncbi:sugar-binding transcriptional regulator [Desulfitobacterium sp. AusDCA]|uniref:sugar-binding transcriptional regulator n=1 Tax=Desulfitobacterium sp. AusDCA TaxID=3240383 RepID=UPI003DA73781
MESEVYNQSTFLTLKAAYLYYLKNKSQNEIADLLKVSIPTVSRLVKKAVKEKIVEFVIRDPYLSCMELEESLRQKFGLKEVVIAPVPTSEMGDQIQTVDNMKRLVALEGARYIQRIISEDDVLGVSWGRTMYHLIHYLNPCQKVEAAFLTLHGSVSNIDNDLDVRTLVSRMAMAFGGRNYSLFTEGIMSNQQLVQTIKKERNVKKVLEMYNYLTISVCGIGVFYPQVESTLYQSDYISDKDMDMLIKENVVADMFLRFINRNGEECNTELRERTLGIDIDTFKSIKTKVTVAAGKSRAYSVLAALKGNLIDVLIIDYQLGKALKEIQDWP